MSSVIIWAASPIHWTYKCACACVFAQLVCAYVCEYVFRLLVRPVWMTCLSNVWAELWIAPGRERERGQGFNLANSLSLFGFGKMQPAPSQFSPCVGDRRSRLFTFPLCAKLSGFLAMNKMHTRSDAHTDLHACTHKHPNCLPLLCVSHSHTDVAEEQKWGNSRLNLPSIWKILNLM